jgi:two-component system phosphate regulon sensor histidine kinase PhoR
MIGLIFSGLISTIVSIAQGRVLPTLSSSMLLLAATAGLMSALWVRRDLLELTAQLRVRVEGGGPLRTMDAPSTDMVPLVVAANDLVEQAQKTVNDAVLKAKELEIQLKVANAERQHAEAIIYSISDAVLVTDPFDDLVLANEAAARSFDFDLKRSARLPVDQVLGDAKVIALIREMRQSNSTSGRRIVEHTLKAANGQDKTFKITLSCVADKTNSAPAGVVAVLHDMTKEKEVAEMKNDFVSNVSHELRTPLASIKAYIEMLIDGEADDDKTKREFYEVIQNEANRLSRLIDNILNISRIESGLVKVNKQPQSLTVIMKGGDRGHRPQAKGQADHVCAQLAR